MVVAPPVVTAFVPPVAPRPPPVVVGVGVVTIVAGAEEAEEAEAEFSAEDEEELAAPHVWSATLQTSPVAQSVFAAQLSWHAESAPHQ